RMTDADRACPPAHCLGGPLAFGARQELRIPDAAEMFGTGHHGAHGDRASPRAPPDLVDAHDHAFARGPAPPLDPQRRERLHERSRRSMFTASPGSGSVANHASSISRATSGLVSRRLITSTFASFHRRAPAAVAASVHSAARTPRTLFAAMATP